MYYVYVIWSDKLGKRYVGFTKNVDKRLREHNNGKTPFTSRGIPWKVLYVEEYESLTEARSREKFLKSESHMGERGEIDFTRLYHQIQSR